MKPDIEKPNMLDFESVVLRLASPENILAWSYGEVTKPETINYRTAKPERDGLFDERIFGPTKDWECYCGKYRRIRYKGIVCDKCGVEVTRAIVRRERMGHISLASPVAHIWFLKSVPSKIGLLLNIPVGDIEKVVYFAGYIITRVDEGQREAALKEIEREYRTKSKETAEEDGERLKDAKEKIKRDIRGLHVSQVLSEVEYHRLSRKFGNVFEAGIGADVLRALLAATNLEELEAAVEKEAGEGKAPDQRKLLRRLRVIKGMRRSGIRPEWMFLTVIPVIPPDLRPMVQLDGGRFATSDLNDLYRRVINRNNRLKRLFELAAPDVIIRNEKRMLQEAVDALIDNSIRRGSVGPAASQAQRRPLKSFADILRGKQGRFRQNLLGKRVDYSGRSVIVAGPDLYLHECGLPKRMALELFKPFVIRELIKRELAHNIRGAGRLIEDEDAAVWEALEEVIQGRYVLLNRAPTLHRLGIQAFQPRLIEGNAIQVHPLVCPAFNADFDGDQMAVHLPLTDEAQAEARDIMLSAHNLLKPATGDPIVDPNQDIVLGCYFATTIREGAKGEGSVFASEEDAILAYEAECVDLGAKVRVRRVESAASGASGRAANRGEIIETSVGRVLFNRILPPDFPYVNKQMKRKDLAEVIARIIKKYGAENTPPVLDNIKRFGFEYATISGISWGMDDLVIPPEKEDLVRRARDESATIVRHFQDGLLTERERHARIVDVWTGVINAITARVPEVLKQDGPVYTMVDSRARGTWTQIRQMSGIRGLVVNPAGRIIELPVISSYKEGLNVLEFFNSTHGARKGTADTALRTAAAGYLTRRLVDVSQDVIISESDCGSAVGYPIERGDSEEINRTLSQRAFSRVLAEGLKTTDGKKTLIAKGEIVDDDKARLIEEAGAERIVVRSPLTCKSRSGVCQMCYGYDLGHNAIIRIGEAIGVVAAQAIGEPGTQLTMRTFHTGGVLSGSGDITTGLPRVQEVFEVRQPKGQAVLATMNGTIIDIAEEGIDKIIKLAADPGDILDETEADDGEVKKGRGKKRGAKGKDRMETFRVPRYSMILVNVDDTVRKGQMLTEGRADLQELYSLTDRRTTERYIIKEIQKIYSLQGAPIHDKHIEVIVRQMFNRLRITDAGDTALSPGETVERRHFEEVNEVATRDGKKRASAKELLLGITRVALTTESFLSAASFQETTRVLVDAAVEGRKDNLRGLKENVIIGRLIPAGTGYRK